MKYVWCQVGGDSYAFPEDLPSEPDAHLRLIEASIAISYCGINGVKVERRPDPDTRTLCWWVHVPDAEDLKLGGKKGNGPPKPRVDEVKFQKFQLVEKPTHL